MYHVVRGDDLEVLEGFVAEQVTAGYQATQLYRLGENTWEVTLWQSISSDLGRTGMESRCAATGTTYRFMQIEHVLHENETHDERGAINSSATPDGSLYVPVQLKEDTKEDDRLLVMFPDQCNHGVTICTECAGSWEIDYEVRYSDTEAGRELSEQRAAQP
ncbi:hypothetical protein [Nocardia vaccinii]|uniref:hypothetical protein n=1 Tax=Nocardia vaccinii TaxID=1822 RepID=UPI00083183AB|nr:hypothetical protein [Nocardia vaccinii]